MSEKENQLSTSKDQQLLQDFDDQSSAVDASRRHFSRSGLAVSGVLLTLASRPVLGGWGTCQAPSGFVSGNVSHHGTPTTCGGRTPGYWGNHPSEWPSPYDPGKCGSAESSSTKKSSSSKSSSPSSSGGSCSSADAWSEGTLFRSVFNCSGFGSIYYAKSMMQVIWLGGSGDPQQLGAHIVAALLNAKKGWTPVLTETQVIAMFNEWNLNGYFEPTAGVKWHADDIVTYLKTTMPL